MSTWTDERHDQVRRRLNATDGALHLGWDDGLDEPMQEVVANAYDDIADALDEIERLRALTTITNDMVKRAGEALYENFEAQSPHWNYTNGDFQGATLDGGYDFETALRAALEAAFTPKEETPDA